MGQDEDIACEHNIATVEEVLDELRHVSGEKDDEEDFKPRILRRLSIQDSIKYDDALRRFMVEASEYPEAAIFEMKGVELPKLVPHPFHDCTLWFTRMPALLEPWLASFAQMGLGDETWFSTDLMQARTHLCWEAPQVKVHFPVSNLNFGFPDTARGALPCILLLLVAGGSLILTVHPIDDMFMTSLQCRGMSTDGNYRPYRVHSEEKLDAARELAKRTGRTPLGFVTEDGGMDVQLQTLVRKHRPASDDTLADDKDEVVSAGDESMDRSHS